jgi:glycosyltransferase involved in cell wall biosynthesis
VEAQKQRMKVALVHNFYRSAVPSGENRVVEEEHRLLAEAGVETLPLWRHSDSLLSSSLPMKVRAAAGPIYSREAVRELSVLIRNEKPDVIHVHNVFPLLSPWVVRIGHAHGVPIIQTVHNFRHTCLAGVHVREGAACFDCVGTTFSTPGIRHACYRDSRTQSVVMATSRAAHRRTWGLVRRYLAVSAFQASELVRLGLPADRVAVKPNPVRDVRVPRPLGRDVVFVGRLSEDKGLRLLLTTWCRSAAARAGRRLVLAGDGPLRSEAERASRTEPSIVVRGLLDRVSVESVLQESGVLVMPSVAPESFGLVAVEAFAAGRPVIATPAGALAEIVNADVGWVVECDETSLAEALAASADAAVSQQRGAKARQLYENSFSEAAATARLIQHYKEVTD